MEAEINKDLPPHIFEMLSERGKKAFFPKTGILEQGAEAKNKRYNATIGIAKEEDGSIMVLPSVTDNINLEPETLDYISSFGKPELRELWGEMIKKKNTGIDGMSKPVVTNALTHGLNVAGCLFLDEGDEVIIPDLFWGNYKMIFSKWYKTGFNTFPLFEGEGFNTGGFAEKLEEPGEKKVVLLNFPNNPTGYSPTLEEAEEIKNILLQAAESGKKIIVIVDDAYFGLVYEEGILEESIFARLSGLHENILAVKVDGATKEDYAWGLRVGFLTYGFKGMDDKAAAALEDKTAGVIRGSISNVSHLSQTLLYEAYKSEGYEEQKEEKLKTLKARYKEAKRVLSEHPGFKENFTPLPFNAGYFMCVKLREGLNAEKIRRKLLEKYDTGVIALGENIIRIAFSSIPLKQIEQLFKNINPACDE